MPKLKTKKGVAKRFKLTKTGKLKHRPCGKSHLMSSKNAKRLRRLRKMCTLENKTEMKYFKRMLPYK